MPSEIEERLDVKKYITQGIGIGIGLSAVGLVVLFVLAIGEAQRKEEIRQGGQAVAKELRRRAEIVKQKNQKNMQEFKAKKGLNESLEALLGSHLAVFKSALHKDRIDRSTYLAEMKKAKSIQRAVLSAPWEKVDSFTPRVLALFDEARAKYRCSHLQEDKWWYDFGRDESNEAYLEVIELSKAVAEERVASK